MKAIPCLLVALCLFFGSAVASAGTDLQQGVAAFLERQRNLDPEGPWVNRGYSIASMLKKEVADATARRDFHRALVRDAEKIAAELDALVPLVSDLPGDKPLVQRIALARRALADAAKDKAKAAEAARRLAELAPR